MSNLMWFIIWVIFSIIVGLAVVGTMGLIKELKNSMFGNDDPILGEIRLFPWEHEIEGYLICDGRSLDMEQNVALYSLLGFHYGGSEEEKVFSIPYLPAVKGMVYAICIDGRYPIRKT